MVKEELMETIRKMLEERLRELLGEAQRTVSHMTDLEAAFPDPTDRASFESDMSYKLRIKDRERKLIPKIRAALERIEKGTYGICEECGEEISEERLLARPVTTLCIKCKTRQEHEEKIKGI